MFSLYIWFKNLLKRSYDKIIHKYSIRYIFYIMIIFSFTESFIFIIPPDFLLWWLIYKNKKYAFFYGLICLIASILGGIIGYTIGYFLYEYIMSFSIFSIYLPYMERLMVLYYKYGAWIILLGGISPFPYKIVSVFSGVMHTNIGLFIIFSILGRGARFMAPVIVIYIPNIKNYWLFKVFTNKKKDILNTKKLKNTK